MKKILVLLSMFALASGAWANNWYTWTIKITDLPASYSVPGDLVAYLLDVNDPQAFDPSGTGYNTFCTLYNASLPPEAALHVDWNDTDGKYAHVSYTFSTPNENKINDNGSNIKTVLVSPSTGRYQMLDTTFSETSGQGTLGATARFNPVPEPTSALLLLLGVAGLALKRKKAA